MVTLLDLWGRKQGEIDRIAASIEAARFYVLMRDHRKLERWCWFFGLAVAVAAVIAMVVA